MSLNLLYKTGLFILSAVLLSAPALASDSAKEKRWQTQIVDSLMVGEAITLQAGTTDFLALYAESTTPKTRGGIILLHGIGVHPAWPDVIEPLRTELPDHGWATLSLQMPILPNEATVKDYVPLLDEAPARIQAGIAFLRSKKIKNIAIVAHSLGAAMASAFLADNPNSGVRAFVGIGMGYSDADLRLDNSVAIARLKLPVLDIYGSRDLESVRRHAAKRLTAANKSSNKRYTQIKVDGADHFFNGMDNLLVKRVHGWLTANSKPK